MKFLIYLLILFIKYIYPRKPLRARMPTNMERDKKKIKSKVFQINFDLAYNLAE